uniref:Uncharacterized protein n=1 Tax=Manihot esculenta TaxID=3983 RepID=A0A2C9W4S4_MANES
MRSLDKVCVLYLASSPNAAAWLVFSKFLDVVRHCPLVLFEWSPAEIFNWINCADLLVIFFWLLIRFLMNSFDFRKQMTYVNE